MKNNNAKTKDFTFKQFKVTGGYSGMPVSTDSVLLGTWCDLHRATKVLDIGTGTGLLALICAQRNPNCTIDAIEIDDQACSAAKTNFDNSPWHTRINLLSGDVLTFPFQSKYDAIICNPPYFDTGETSSKKQRAIARHTLTLNHQALLTKVLTLVTEEGKAWFVLPEAEGRKFIELALSIGWNLTKLCEVQSTDRKPPHRLLIQLAQIDTGLESQQLIIQTNNAYTEDFIALTQDFYLKM
ncbi:tRNA1(Val) (adenine(37)-N6)-methyltransferase [Vibrio zhanjiangensis]|uniref:tRNA1(Val) (adenine(37)-N6)-methyltransferase n=1 Tax=Vibrio zhanjiangensis TaxID=1046128 RepID=A0ABQ6F138_9VIBR|nr:methyltransferase [Vibrio zhanjiangensis]GLT18485.1 tRNA1(Val) (adenine(37)-N6)-methyltransferase [Vibrio zhanjiangensis]